MEAPIGLVLAGGAGRRLGLTKGHLVVAGRSLALRAAEAVAPVCRGVLVSVRAGASNPAPGYPAIEDPPPVGRGPLAGIDAAFAATQGTDLLVLACDYARVSTDLLRRLLECAERAASVVLIQDRGRRDHPLVALWRRGMQPAVREALRREAFRVADLVAASEVQRLGGKALAGIDLDAALLNVNRPNDLERLERSV